MNENEIKAREFLEYVAENLEILKHNLKKNITYDEEIFDDSFHDSILKVYNSIIKNGTEVNDWTQYFFISSKFTYIYLDNKNRKKKDLEVRGLLESDTFDMYEEEIDEQERWNKVVKAIKQIKELISNNFSEKETEIYLNYILGKVGKQKTSYKTIAEDYKMSIKDITKIITSIKSYLKDNNDLIKNIKCEYIE